MVVNFFISAFLFASVHRDNVFRSNHSIRTILVTRGSQRHFFTVCTSASAPMFPLSWWVHERSEHAHLLSPRNQHLCAGAERTQSSRAAKMAAPSVIFCSRVYTEICLFEVRLAGKKMKKKANSNFFLCVTGGEVLYISFFYVKRKKNKWRRMQTFVLSAPPYSF